jgi:hypothetical protein
MNRDIAAQERALDLAGTNEKTRDPWDARFAI